MGGKYTHSEFTASCKQAAEIATIGAVTCSSLYYKSKKLNLALWPVSLEFPLYNTIITPTSKYCNSLTSTYYNSLTSTAIVSQVLQ